MSNFGFTDLRLVNPYDLAFREARSAVRSHYILEQARVCASVAEAIADAHLVIGTTAARSKDQRGHRDLHAPLYPLEAAAQLIAEQPPQHTVALLFGSEKFGLSNEQMSHCHWLLHIPTRDEHASMNLGQAVAICLYELRRNPAREAQRFPSPDLLSGENRERFTALLLEALHLSGYVPQRASASAELKLRRLILRLGLPASDAETWLGMLRQILWKLKQE
jgi:tRNA/rRNA methyltransferase